MIVNDEEVTVLYEKETITKLIYLQKLWLPTHFVIFLYRMVFITRLI